MAFGATAALAVIVGRGAPVDAALASAKSPGAQHATASGRPPAGGSAATGRCAVSGLRISLGPGARMAGSHVTGPLTRYPLDFTNVSGVPCTLAGYPEVAAYRGDGVQVGAAAGHDLSVTARRIVLAPGQTAHASLDAVAPAARCAPVRVTGFRVVAPGQAAARYVRRPLTACTARAPHGQDYLLVRAIQAGPGGTVGSTGGGSAGPAAPTVTATAARPD